LEKVAETDAAGSAEPAPPPAEGALSRLPPPDQRELSAAAEQQSAVVTGRAQAAPTEALADAEAALEDRAGPPRQSESVAAVAVAPKREHAKAVATDEAAAFNGFAERGATPQGAGGLRLELTGEDGARLATLALPAPSPAVGSRLVVTLADGVIVTIEPEPAGTTVGSALDALIGRRLPGLPDGRYLGVVVSDNPVP